MNDSNVIFLEPSKNDAERFSKGNGKFKFQNFMSGSHAQLFITVFQSTSIQSDAHRSTFTRLLSNQNSNCSPDAKPGNYLKPHSSILLKEGGGVQAYHYHFGKKAFELGFGEEDQDTS